ncbi:MAG TPA: DNA repair protein RecN [Spongiibacteraceae bacterium]|nr:DNA repair protein RecN [Spongiibacteraceae bacterium]
MLTHLSVDNYAIAEHIEAEFERGMTALTGETGAGKSILLDALGLALGDRADASAVRAGAERAEIHAAFDVSAIREAKAWLEARELLAGDECLLRRTITSEGRSRGYINGQPATLQDLKAIGELLIDIYSQHAHQSLLQRTHQRRLLDAYAGTETLADTVKKLAQQYQLTAEQLDRLSNQRDEQTARAQLLSYQVEELDKLDLGADELQALEDERRTLANGEQILRNSQHALALCREGEINVVNILNQVLKSLGELDAKQPSLVQAEDMLNSALIQVEEASHELQHYVDGFELDPERLADVETRLDAIYDITRKHRVQPNQLCELHAELRAELDSVAGGSERIEQLQTALKLLRADYDKQAQELSKRRTQAAQKLQKQVEKQLQALAMGGCKFSVALASRETPVSHGDSPAPHVHGNEDIEFLISTNPGTPPQALNRIASGGELSRISLAIQVITAQTSAIPTLVFDEVDVGIGGATAEVVGNLLRELGSRGQVLCVTHQPQVASKGHQHFTVEKIAEKKTVRTQLRKLGDSEKIEEIARMLGGIAVTEQSRAHAKEMLSFTH